jgi:nucleoside-diphosphate-sugar epimerase
MKIIITGSSGLLGSALVTKLSQEGNEVYGLSRGEKSDIVIDLSIASEKEIHQILDKFNPEALIHCAGNLRPQSLDDFLVNANSIKNFFTHRQAKKIKFIIIGSVAEYGLVNESICSIDEKTPVGTQSLYGQSKFFQTAVSSYFKSRHNLDISVLRISNLVSPFLPSRSFIGALLNQIAGRSAEAVSVPSYKCVRDFIDVRDVAELINSMIIAPRKDLVYLVGSGLNSTYGQIIDILIIY